MGIVIRRCCSLVFVVCVVGCMLSLVVVCRLPLLPFVGVLSSFVVVLSFVFFLGFLRRLFLLACSSSCDVCCVMCVACCSFFLLVC